MRIRTQLAFRSGFGINMYVFHNSRENNNMNMGSAYYKQSTWKTSKRGLAFIDLLLQQRQGYGVGR